MERLFNSWLLLKEAWCAQLGRRFRKSRMKKTDRAAIVRALEANHEEMEILAALGNVANDNWLMGRTERKKSPSFDLPTILMIRPNGKHPLDRVSELLEKDRPDSADSGGRRRRGIFVQPTSARTNELRARRLRGENV